MIASFLELRESDSWKKGWGRGPLVVMVSPPTSRAPFMPQYTLMRRGPGPCTAAPITISLGAHCKVLLPVPTLSLQTSPSPQGQWSEIVQNTYRGVICGDWKEVMASPTPTALAVGW